MDCRVGCGACCIAPSISQPIPGMPNGKAAGERCVNLDPAGKCLLWGSSARPQFCISFKAEAEFCGNTSSEALINLTALEQATL